MVFSSFSVVYYRILLFQLITLWWKAFMLEQYLRDTWDKEEREVSLTEQMDTIQLILIGGCWMEECPRYVSYTWHISDTILIWKQIPISCIYSRILPPRPLCTSNKPIIDLLDFLLKSVMENVPEENVFHILVLSVKYYQRTPQRFVQ